MNLCAEYHFVAEDLRLNELYGKARAKLLKGTGMSLLVKSQRAWLSFRDATCEYQSQGYEGGTLRASVALNCMNRLTVERSRQLEEHISCTTPGCPR